MYACESCLGTVFSGIGIVEHMLQVHGIRLDSVNTAGSHDQPVTSMPTRSMEITTVPPNTVSIGTQAQLAKKPGRKRKVLTDVAASAAGEEQEQTSKHRATTAEKHSAAAMAVKTLGIERLTAADGGSGVSKRRIQPPRALVEDYHILRLRQSTPRVRSSAAFVAPEIPCSFSGCSATFRHQEAVEYHVKCHTDGGSFCCPECCSSFVEWSSLMPHLWTVHGVDLYAYQCSRCDFRADQFSTVTEHTVAEHGACKPVQPFPCSVCGQTFRKASLQKQHEKSHNSCSLFSRSRTRPELTAFRRCICDMCKRSFANRKSLSKHVEIVHRKIKPFACSKCDYVAARKAMLQLHERIHTGEKPFKCDVCSYSASDHNTLRRHRMRHTGQKPYRCAFCDYTAIQAISLKTHVRAKHPAVTSSAAAVAADATSVYSCQSCSYQTVNRRSWLGHLQDHRNNPPPVTSTEQLFIIEKQNDGQLVLAPLVNVTQTVTVADQSVPVLATSEFLHRVTDGFTSPPDAAHQLGLRHVWTPISEHQQGSTPLQTVVRYN